MFKLQIKTDNQAFEQDKTAEVCRILEEVILKLKEGNKNYSRNNGNKPILLDLNGNVVGHYTINNR